MVKSSPPIERHARLGAENRLTEGRRPSRPRTTAAATDASRRKDISAAARKTVGERMKRYWAECRKAEGAKKR